VLFTDGRDEISRSSYDQMLERARRAGVIVYAVALAEAFAGRDERRPLEELAAQTGGEAYFLDGLAALEATYDRILRELRSRYLLAYEPPAGGERDEFRTIEVEVDVRGAEVRARSGYYP
jgi:VWFA-related protein